MEPTPLVFQPILKAKVWGGDRLHSVAGRVLEPGARIGESWEICDRPGDVSVVAAGPNDGRTLAEFVRRDAEALMGHAVPAGSGARFPLLVKLIDATQTLSVQVHPDDAYARAHHLPDLGKTEAWYVLHAEPGAVMFKGLRPEVTREEFRRLIAADRVEAALHAFAVRRNDVVFCPAGVVHAVGAGLVLVEIQQNSDATFRVYDWGRHDEGRPLHVEESLAVAAFGVQTPDYVAPEPLNDLTPAASHVAQPPSAVQLGAESQARAPAPHGQRERLVACDQFVIERWRFDRTLEVDSRDEMALLTIVDGVGRISGGGLELAVRRGDSVLLPACLRFWSVQPREPLTVLRTTLPK